MLTDREEIVDRRERGSALLSVLILGAIVSMATVAFFANSTPKVTANVHVFRQKRNFYVAESTRYLAVNVAQEYITKTKSPTSDGLQLALQERLPKLLPEGFIVEKESIKAEIISQPVPMPIPNGPYAGMIAPQSTVKYSYDVKSEQDTDDRNVTSMTVTMALAQVGLFQFMYFIDLDFADFNPGPTTVVDGRIHANGDFCIAGQAGVTFSKITTAGRLMHGSDQRCAYRSTGNNTLIASGEGLTKPVPFTSSTSSGCKNCGGTQLNWQPYALQAWNENALDVAHGVTALSLPIPRGLNAQLGADRDDRYVTRSNNKTLRFLLDPVQPGDSLDVKSMKYSHNADLRIIDGVWYLKDPGDPARWPGIAIWSDHPTSFIDPWGYEVGQEDLRSRWSSRGMPWPATGSPKRFSYYDFNPATRLQEDTHGVISYGTLARETSVSPDPTWAPGHWISASANQANRLCGPGGSLSGTSSGVHSAFKPLTCGTGTSPSIGAALLNGTRSGIRDPHILMLYPASSSVRYDQSKLLPMNFDAQQFQQALADTSPGELGSYFGEGRFMNRDFNGVVYLSTSWPGSLNGFDPRGVPLPAPAQGSRADGDQLGITSNFQQQALPYPLCAPRITVVDAKGVRANYDKTGRFKIPICEDYGTIQAYPNSVRIVNGAALDPAKFEKGLSLVSNLPVYITGSFNTKSVVSAQDSQPWMPAMVGGDQVTFLSNNWDDANSPWSTSNFPRAASTTTYNMGVISGWARSQESVQVHAIPSLMEDWQGQTLNFNGSIVVGFYPVYYRHGRYWDPAVTYAAGERRISFDKHFGLSVNQPPGSPLFFVSAVIDWKTK